MIVPSGTKWRTLSELDVPEVSGNRRLLQLCRVRDLSFIVGVEEALSSGHTHSEKIGLLIMAAFRGKLRKILFHSLRHLNLNRILGFYWDQPLQKMIVITENQTSSALKVKF